MRTFVSSTIEGCPAVQYVMQHELPSLVNAGELLQTMTVRLQMQQSRITNPRVSVKRATELLVERLGSIPASDAIETSFAPGVLARYVRVSTGEVLAEIPEHDA